MWSIKKRCPMCEKTYYIDIPDNWAYKGSVAGGIVYYCSWKCLRAYEKCQKFTAPKPLTGRAAQIAKLVKEGLGTTEISKKLGINPATVTYWKGRI